MEQPIREAGEHVQAARDKAAQAREALEQDPGEEVVQDPSVLDAIHSALYDMDYALAKATLSTKWYLDEVAEDADEGYDHVVEELSDLREGVKGFWEGITESSPTRTISARLQGLEQRLEGVLEMITGKGED